MHLGPILVVFLMGCAAFAVSLYPAVIGQFIEGLHASRDAFRDEIDSTPKWDRHPPDTEAAVRLAPRFFAPLGAILILVSALAFIERL